MAQAVPVQNVAIVQPMVMAMPMMMPMQGAPGQQDMDRDKEFAYLDFNQMKSFMMNTADGNIVLYEKNMDCQDWCKGLCMFWCTCGACELREFKFQGPGHAVTIHKPQGCCTDWSVKLDSKGTVGGNRKAGMCAGGCVHCLTKYAMCWGTDKYYEMYRVGGQSSGKEIFSLRKKLFPMWCCADIICSQMAAVMSPCTEQCGRIAACCKFCANTEYNTIKQPIYGPWGSGNEPIGHISKVERAIPSNPCCATLEPVRVSVQVPGTTDTGDVANLGFLALVYSKRIPVDFQTPKGHPCLDCGLSVASKWETFEDMVNQNSATSGITGEERK